MLTLTDNYFHSPVYRKYKEIQNLHNNSFLNRKQSSKHSCLTLNQIFESRPITQQTKRKNTATMHIDASFKFERSKSTNSKQSISFLKNNMLHCKPKMRIVPIKELSIKELSNKIICIRKLNAISNKSQRIHAAANNDIIEGNGSYVELDDQTFFEDLAKAEELKKLWR